MKQETHSPWRSVTFKLAFYYSLLTLVTMLAVLVVMHWGTDSLLAQRTERQITADAQKILRKFDKITSRKVAKRIRRALADEREPEGGVYLLVDAEGQAVEGHLDRMPPTVEADAGLQEAQIPPV